ncbi:MAG: hypothetical protein ACXWV0_09935 [Flavisolibacter sp.]
MRIIFLFAILGLLANVVIAQQLVLMPQAGGQQFRIIQNSAGAAYSKNYFTGTSISLGARLHYTSRKQHGLFIGFHATEMMTGSLINHGSCMPGMLQRYEAGYQVMSSRLYLNRKQTQEKFSNKGLFLQFQPAVGMVIHKLKSGTDSDHSGPVIYDTKSKSVSPGLMTNLGIMIGRDNRPVLNVSLYYVKGLSKAYEGSYQSPGISYTQLSRGSSIGLSFGIPVTIFNRK